MSYGSGEFVQEREWTCPDHDRPHDHMCDCDHCEREWDCDKCAVASWVDVFNADGTRKMREVGLYESLVLRQLAAGIVEHKNILLQTITMPDS